MDGRVKQNKNVTPKTPGGISKSLLTPCRRVGLPRTWKKQGPSPFISPLTKSDSTNTVFKEDKQTRKRKDSAHEEEKQYNRYPLTPLGSVLNEHCNEIISTPASLNIDVCNTPVRNVDVPRRKKTKTLLSSIKNCEETIKFDSKNDQFEQSSGEENSFKNGDIIETDNDDKSKVEVAKPVQKSYKRNKNCISPFKSTSKIGDTEFVLDAETKEHLNYPKQDEERNIWTVNNENTKLKKPNNLTKECIVVIQEKIGLRTGCNYPTTKELQKEETIPKQNTNKEQSNVSQDIFDPDDIPLSHLYKKNVTGNKISQQTETLDNDDFIETKSKAKVKKLVDKNTSTGSLNKSTTKNKIIKKDDAKIKPKTMVKTNKPLSQSSNSLDEDDDDDVFESKRTILIRKSYNKVAKIPKAKSTGSITQRDIDELRARIEMKKKLLLAKTMSEETKELRDLIKKWQKGCQDALVELMELMKNKVPDRQNMDYAEILQMLRIPPALVGYDSENDCFITPDDASIILSKFNNL